MRKVVLTARPVMDLPQEGKAPTEFRVLRAGVNKTEKGQFLFDELAQMAVMEAYRAKGLDKVQIDYEHQSTQPPPAGGRAEKPAAGWFRPEVRAGELWATAIAWTTRALGMLEPPAGAPEYRFFSPVLAYDEESRRVTALKNLALTNDPAMDDITPLMAATALDHDKESEMPCDACAALTAKLTELQAANSTLTARLSAFEEKDREKGASLTALTGVRDKVVALTGQATEAAALGTVEAWKAKAAQTDQLLADRATEQLAVLTAELGRVLDGAVKAGKLAPAMRAVEEKGALMIGGGKVSKDAVDYLTAKWGAAPNVVNPGGEGNPTEKKTNVAVLTAADLEVARVMGHDIKDVEAWKTKRIEDQAREQALSASFR